MNPERWQHIKEIYHSALELEPGQRDAFLKKACAGDEDLVREVESLLAQEGDSKGLFEGPALNAVAKALAQDQAQKPQQNLTGHTLSHYRIEKKIGEGGMGEVFLAQDTSLNRKVALKLLPPEMQQDPVAHKRFLREAHSAAALDNPFICSIHEVRNFEGKEFIVMEYVDGQTLMEKLHRGRLPLNHALQIAAEVAEALQTAHGKGIIHRDLKPANIMLTKTGHAKVMDFGLAKQVVPLGGVEIQEKSLSAMTRTGMTLGTLAYMSPEQVRGEEVDPRSDIFSFGLLLYEMLAGTHPFRKKSPVDTGSAILHEDPKPISAISQGIPTDLEKLVSRCLRKDVERRIQHMDDVKLALVELKEDLDAGRGTPSIPLRRKGRSYLWFSMILAAGAVFAVVAWLWLGRSRPLIPESPIMAVPFTTYPGSQRAPTFSPDGKAVAFQRRIEGEGANWDIYIKQVGSESVRQLTTDPNDDLHPAWSPDGQSIAFLRDIGHAKAAVVIIPANGGRELRVAELKAESGRDWKVLHRNLSWHPGGKWLAVAWDQDSPAEPWAIFLLSPETHEKRRLTSPPKGINGDATPAFSPDGRSLVFSRYFTTLASEIYAMPVSAGLTPEGEPKQLTSGQQLASAPAWTPDGKEIIYSFGSQKAPNLWRIPASGSGKPILLPFAGGNCPAISLENHRMVYVLDINRIYDLWRCPIPNKVENAGPPSSLVASTQTKHVARYSPNGKEILYVSFDSGNPEIWICNSDGSHPFQLTRLGGPDPGSPCWSPDGQQIVFTVHSGNQRDVYLIPAQGGRPQQLTRTPFNERSASFSRNGKSIYFESNRSGEEQIWKMPVEGGEQVQVTRKGGWHNAGESMDGKNLFYWKRKAPEPDVGELWKVSVDGGEEIRVLESVSSANFDVKEHGIYYARSSGNSWRWETAFFYYQFNDGKTVPIATIQKAVAYGFSVSPDERWILYTQAEWDFARSNLMLVENLR